MGALIRGAASGRKEAIVRNSTIWISANGPTAAERGTCRLLALFLRACFASSSHFRASTVRVRTAKIDDMKVRFPSR